MHRCDSIRWRHLEHQMQWSQLRRCLRWSSNWWLAHLLSWLLRLHWWHIYSRCLWSDHHWYSCRFKSATWGDCEIPLDSARSLWPSHLSDRCWFRKSRIHTDWHREVLYSSSLHYQPRLLSVRVYVPTNILVSGWLSNNAIHLRWDQVLLLIR